MSESSKIIVCPYCGHTQPAANRCAECGGLFEPLSRRATQVAMGPWFIRDKKNPFRPGCSFETLKKQIAAGRVKPMSVVRGPTTRQLWSVARNIPGVAHLIGYCHRCGAHVKPDAMSCPECMEAFREPSQRDELGLLYPTATEAAAAQRAIELEIEAANGRGKAATGSNIRQPRGTSPEPAPSPETVVGPATAGVDLLDEVVGKPIFKSKRQATVASPPTPAEPLSFAPSDESMSPPANRQSPIIWLLVSVIVLLFLLLALVFVRFFRHG